MNTDMEIYLFQVNQEVDDGDIKLSINKAVGRQDAVAQVCDLGNDVRKIALKNVEDIDKLIQSNSRIEMNGKKYALATEEIVFKSGNKSLLSHRIFHILRDKSLRLGLKMDEDLCSKIKIKLTRERENGPWTLIGSDDAIKRFTEKSRMILLYDCFFSDDEVEKNESPRQVSNSATRKSPFLPSVQSFDDYANVACASNNAKVNLAEKVSSTVSDSDEEECSICKMALSDAETLSGCGHRFHKTCIENWLKVKPVCPYCKQPNVSPQQRMKEYDGYFDKIFNYEFDIEGYDDAIGHIVIEYSILPGVQGLHDPNPGFPFSGTSRRAYLPNNGRGRKIAKCLESAFNAGLVFNIGISQTTGIKNTIVWSTAPLIPHKTNLTGGPRNYGYPDPIYLDSVENSLRNVGIDVASVTDD